MLCMLLSGLDFSADDWADDAGSEMEMEMILANVRNRCMMYDNHTRWKLRPNRIDFTSGRYMQQKDDADGFGVAFDDLSNGG